MNVLLDLSLASPHTNQMNEPHGDPEELHCFSQAPGKLGLMVQTSSGTHKCPECDLVVQLKSRTVPQAWYHASKNPRPLSADDPALPFCETCNGSMLALSSVRNIRYGTQSIVFICQSEKEILHRLETYFVKIPEQEFAEIKRELKEGYATYMISDLIGRNFPIERILQGPNRVDLDLSTMLPQEKDNQKERFKFLEAIGLLTYLKIGSETISFSFNKELLVNRYSLFVK